MTSVLHRKTGHPNSRRVAIRCGRRVAAPTDKDEGATECVGAIHESPVSPRLAEGKPPPFRQGGLGAYGIRAGVVLRAANLKLQCLPVASILLRIMNRLYPPGLPKASHPPLGKGGRGCGEVGGTAGAASALRRGVLRAIRESPLHFPPHPVGAIHESPAGCGREDGGIRRE